MVGDSGETIVFSPIDILNLAFVVAAAWGVWHVYMQKYGILRLYNAKSRGKKQVPGWVDRLLVFCWLPFYLVWLGPTYRASINEAFGPGKKALAPIFDLMEVVKPYLIGPAVVVIVVAVALFVLHEYKVNRLRSYPRLWMGAGTLGISSMFLFLHPLAAYLAYGFSHAVEYMVFVWAFQRRRYRQPLGHKPLLGRILLRPWLAYGVFTLGLAGMLLVWRYWGLSIFPELEQPHLLGFRTKEWVMYWVVFQSTVHFYFDGFLWKMGLPSTRANI